MDAKLMHYNGMYSIEIDETSDILEDLETLCPYCGNYKKPYEIGFDVLTGDGFINYYCYDCDTDFVRNFEMWENR